MTTNLARIATIIVTSATPMTALDHIQDVAAGPKTAAEQAVAKRA